MIQIEAFNLIDHIHKSKDIRTKRSLLPFGRLFNFLFGTANDDDVRTVKQDVQKSYDNQISQSKVLNDVISIANISRCLINANIMKINQIISTVSFLNGTIDSIMNQLKPLFTPRRFLLLHTELLIHHSRIRSLQMKTDTAQIKAYLNICIIGKLTVSISHPIQLRWELLRINQQLLTRLSLPEDPHRNIWHYYRLLTVSPVTHVNKLVLMIRIPLIDLDSSMNLFELLLGPCLVHDTTLRVLCQVVHYLVLMHPLLEPHGKGFLFCHVGLKHLHRQTELSVSSVPLPQDT